MNTMEVAKKQMKAEEANITEADPLSQRQKQRQNDRSSRGRGRTVINSENRPTRRTDI